MADLLLKLAENPQASTIVRRLGLPIPLPQKLRRAAGPYEALPLAGRHVYVASARPEGALAPVIERALAAAGATVRTAQGGTSADEKVDAIVFDASGIEDSAALSALYEHLHPWVGRLKRNGRLVVLGRTLDGLEWLSASAQAALDGFVRSAGKELGRLGATANLVRVQPGAEDRAGPVLRFLLSDRASFISGQPMRVTDAVRASKSASAMRPLEGKVALVTGAARGIGEATARRLADEGAHVVVLDRPSDEAKATALAMEIGGSVLLADVADPAAPERIAGELKARHGGVDIVVHNAGITRDKTLARMRREQWDQVLAVNLQGIERITQALLPLLRDEGRIVCLSSVGGLAGNMGQTNYAATKAGVAGLVRALAPQLAPRGVTVNAVAPGLIETQMTAQMPLAIREAARRMSSLSQGGQPIDIAEAVTFLATPGASGVTGEVLRVCGQMLVGA